MRNPLVHVTDTYLLCACLLWAALLFSLTMLGIGTVYPKKKETWGREERRNAQQEKREATTNRTGA